MNSLNPFIEENNIEAFKDETGLMKLFNENMFYGDDNTGNIFNFTDNDVKNIIKDGKYDFITADGSINTVKCQDSQEKIVFPLIEKEVAIALECLNENGIFIIKMYTFFEEETQQLLRKLCKSFEKIFVVKPCFSKSSNSEVYVVLQNYLKRINCINEEYFIANIIKCSELFASYQIEAIQTNIDAFNNNLLDSKVIKSIFNTIKKEVINDYFEKRMKTISNAD
uniref:FtsJ domain-containing protein n=1 Tax=Parastrongyloides trichosuri TaxID=131310 RepID=A0A0N4ZRI1_PARTI